MIKVLAAMPTAQAKVHINGQNVKLVSYKTVVAELNDDVLVIYGLYSMTTRRHISAFMKEYCKGLTYQTARTLYEQKMSMNIITGECFELTARA